MSRLRVVSCCVLSLLISPITRSAQSKIVSGPERLPVVSVHELRISEKARKAYDQGIQRLAHQDLAGSIPEFQRAIKVFPSYFEAYDKIGIADLGLQRGADAESAFRKSIELSAGLYAEPLFGLGVILCDDHKRLDEAEESIRAGLKLKPDDPAGTFALGWVLYSANRLGEAEETAQRAVSLTPNSPVAYVLLGEVHLRQGNSRALVEDLDAYLRLDSNGPFSAKAKLALVKAEQDLHKESTSTGLRP